MVGEAQFVLKLAEESGLKPAEVALVLKHFWSDGRIDMRSATVQTLLLKLIGEGLVEAAAKKEEEKKNPA